MEEVMGRSTARQSFNMLLLTIFGAVALVLAAIGIYGLIAYSVEQRTQEMGIRMALGADPSAIRKLVVWQGVRLTLVGVAVGIAAAFGLTRLIASYPLRRQALGSGGVYLCAAYPLRCGAARRLAACHARLQTRPHAGVARGVIWKLCLPPLDDKFVPPHRKRQGWLALGRIQRQTGN